MANQDPLRHFTAAIGRRYDFLYLINGKVKVEGLEVEFPPVVKGPPAPIFSALAREHPWDIGEQGFSTYLMAFDLGKPQIALPVFPSRFFPHPGIWVNERSGIQKPGDLVGKRVGCGSFGTNYSVWCRGVLRHQYDVAIEKITWVESVDEHLLEYRAPKRFALERIPGNERAAPLLAGGKIDAATMAGGGMGTELSGIRPLFQDVYPEIKEYVAANGFFPVNTVVTVSRAAVARNPEMPRLMMKAFLEAKALYDAEISTGEEEEHMGLSLKRLESETGLRLSPYGFKANRKCIQTMIAYCYEQGIVRRLYEPEEIFLLLDS